MSMHSPLTLARRRKTYVAGWALAALAVAVTVRADRQDVGAQMRRLIETDWVEQDARFGLTRARQQAIQPSAKVNEYGVTTAQDAAGGCDGVKNGRWGFHVASGEQDPWWQVDLGEEYPLDRLVVFNRTDRGTARRAVNLRALAAGAGKSADFALIYEHDGTPFGGPKEGKPLTIDLKGKGVTARIVRLALVGRCSFALDEVEVYGAHEPTKNLALNRPADQKSVSRYSYPGTLPEGVDSAPPPTRTDAEFSLEHIRDVVERGKALASRLTLDADPSRLRSLAGRLRRLEAWVAAAAGTPDVPKDARRAFYLDARWTLRRIAFCNPLLNIEQLLFIKRHDAGGVFHMCDQFYGCNAKPGGGLCVLCDPFTDSPKLIDVLRDSVVQSGRLQGTKLNKGSFLSPELSFDGKTTLFAYSECQAEKTYTWGETISYHLFRCNADGTGLVQLTDGEPDDFDPCFLPNGRVAFISLRRGGYLRCGRHCPVYTLFSMNPDGGDIRHLSFHETHEWQPSVDNNGMLVYTRWDYVDRDTNIAHHIWHSYPDGRDARSYHGNYPTKREGRPWMEMSIRAIPGSQKYVAVTGSHHGHAFGSLVLIDPTKDDDGGMSQLERLTPDVPFPEAEGRPTTQYMCYGTPWPLSEDDYLCVYDSSARNRGIYWIDRYGNKELIYRDPTISCLSPIPLRPRPMPPVIPTGTKQLVADELEDGRQPVALATTSRSTDRLAPNLQKANASPRATITLLNVYDSDFDWPTGTRVRALRVVQVLPKTTPPPNQPRIGVANQTNARAVLGTVPVEPDGSAYFEAPVGKDLYFQALDDRGLAIQSMRSATYVHPGERLTCQGCHEPKHTSPSPTAKTPAAVRRGPSKIRSDVEGSNPFNYVRLVQPALDRNCVSCHQQKKALDLTGVPEGGFTRSYNNLAGKYGFYFHVSNGSVNQGVHGGVRTIPGRFGAKASALLKYLGEGHHGVKLSDEDFHRFTLWLDCNSEFYGAYEETTEQLKGKLVAASLD